MENEIIENIKGPNVIIAGPGTGKTKTLVDKTKFLINHLFDKKIYNQGIIVCTFTNKATDELKQRLYSQIEIDKLSKIKLFIGTIHKICIDLIKNYGGDEYLNYNLLNEENQTLYIYKKLPNFGYPEKFETAQTMAELFSRINDLDLSKNDLDKIIHKDLKKLAIDEHQIYQEMLKRNKYFDFSTVQKAMLDLLKKKSFKEKIKKDYNFFLIDEYQDVNNVQDKIFKNISDPEYNLTVVGDPDQSIYGWRGSSVNNLKNFAKKFKEKKYKIKEFNLVENHRSTKNIISVANYLAQREKKNKIKSFRNIDGEYPIVIHFKDDISEAKYIGGTIRRLNENKLIKNFDEIAILFRSLNHSTAIQNELSSRKFPYTVIGSNDLLQTRMGFEFLKLFNFYLAAIKKDEIKKQTILDFKDNELEDYKLHDYYDNEKIQEIYDFFKNTKNKARSSIQLTYNLFELGDFLERYKYLGASLGVLTKTASDFDDQFKTFDPYSYYKYLMHLRNRLDQIFEKKDNAIQLMTIHQSKGLEFPIVFIPSQNERQKQKTVIDIMCEQTGQDEHLKNEEKRVFYVGCTRAENLLFASHSAHLTGRRKTYDPKIELSDLESFPHIQKKHYQKSIPLRKKNKRESMVISFNKIKTYNTCPLQYKYRMEWNLDSQRFGGMLFGNNVHQLLEIIFKQIKEGNKIGIKSIEKIIEDNWNNVVFRGDEENLKFKASAKKQIVNFFKDKLNEFNSENIFSVEEPFHYPINENLLVDGRYDLILKNKNNIEIIDFKTGDHKDENYETQLSFYKYCFNKKYKNNNINLFLIYLKDNKKVQVNEKPLKDISDLILRTAKSIEQKNFKATPGKHCSDCAYRSICDFAPKK